MAVEKHDEKLSYFRNGKTVKPTGYSIEEGKKRLWIPTHRIWVDVPIEEPDDEAIVRVTIKFNNALKFNQEDGKSTSKDLQ